MAYKIAIANIKGGIGKTTTAVNLADQLQKRDKRVLTVDMDPQRNTTTVYGAKTEGTATVYDIFFADYTAEQCIQHTSFGDIIPNDSELKNADSSVRTGPAMYKFIKKTLAAVESSYDYIIFDTPPHNGVLLGNVLMACNGVIIPIECDLFGVQGLKDLYSTLTEFAEDNEGLRVLGILKVKYKQKQRLTRNLEDNALPKNAAEMNTKVFNTAIRESVKCREAMIARVPLSEFAPNSTVEQDYSKFTDEVIKEVEG